MATRAAKRQVKADGNWRGAIAHFLRRTAGLILLAVLLAGLALWWAARWTPSRDLYPLQGVTISADNGEVHWGSIKAAGADFAYVAATDGASVQSRSPSSTTPRSAKRAASWGVTENIRMK